MNALDGLRQIGVTEKHYEKKIFVLASNGNAIDELFSPRIADSNPII